MAHGQNASWNSQNKEWWGRRPMRGTSLRNRGMKKYKRWLHKMERQIAKQQVKIWTKEEVEANRSSAYKYAI